MNTLLYIFFFLSLFILVVNLFFYAALNKLFKYKEHKESNVKISVIVAAKNEEDRIEALISALSRQSYSPENYEIIFVDDNSSDNTYKVLQTAAQKLNNTKVIQASEKKYDGKKGALEKGIEISQNEYVLITDADCSPEPDWIKSFAEKFTDGYDFVFGIAPYTQSKSFTNLITRFENLRAHILMFALAKLKAPYSAAARSFGFSKNAFNKISGYKNTTETLGGDDDLLLREAVKNNLSIGLVTPPEAFVFTDSENRYEKYISQKSRHTSTSIYYSLKTKLILAIWHLVNLILLFSILLIPLNSLFVFPVFIKFVIDIFIVNNFQNNFGYKINPIWFIFLQLIYELNLIFFFLNGLRYKKRWN